MSASTRSTRPRASSEERSSPAVAVADTERHLELGFGQRPFARDVAALVRRPGGGARRGVLPAPGSAAGCSGPESVPVVQVEEVLDAGLDSTAFDLDHDAAHRVELLAVAFADVAVQADDPSVLGLEDVV